ncbi:MAG: ABC transporter ATP-binding protein [Deltaproteobacteria bacterium]|nr:ABC transporter ATP-binding protein [Deltaproteobacteria bacterium]
MPPLLSIENLVTSYGGVRAVDDVSLAVDKQARLGIVGESGCGKTTVALSVLRLVSPGRIDSGRILLQDRDLLGLTEREMCAVRGQRISMVFQEPMSSLNPVHTIGAQVTEALTIHKKMSRRAARERAVAMLERVGMPSAGSRFDAWPHQLSGGMRQRVMIAMALICEPEVLLADEPTTALDVTIQAQILELLGGIQEQTGTAIVLITHDLAVLADFAQRVVVMYAGQIVEEAPVGALFASPAHPYARALLDSLPAGPSAAEGGRLPTIPGRVPDLRALPVGCRFQERCSFADETCRTQMPQLESIASDRRVRCFHPLRSAS